MLLLKLRSPHYPDLNCARVAHSFLVMSFSESLIGCGRPSNTIYYRFIVRFPDRVGLPLPNIHIPSPFPYIMDIFFDHLMFGPYPLLHSLTMSFLVFQPVFCLQLYTPYISSPSPHHLSLITCTYRLSLPLLMKVVIGSTPTSLLNSSFVLLSFNEIPTHPSNHLHLCSFKLQPGIN